MSDEQQNQTTEQQPVGPAIEFHELVARSILAVASGHSLEGGVHTRAEHLGSFGDDAASQCVVYLRERIADLAADEAEVYVSSFLASVQASIAKVGLRSVRGRLIPIAVTVAEATLEMYARVPMRIRQLESQFAQGQAQAHMPMSRQPQVPVGMPAASPGSSPQQVEMSPRAAAVLRALGGG
jgi:hypothetical protein